MLKKEFSFYIFLDTYNLIFGVYNHLYGEIGFAKQLISQIDVLRVEIFILQINQKNMGENKLLYRYNYFAQFRLINELIL